MQRIPLGDLKTIARMCRPRGDPFLELILSQPDSLPRDIFRARIRDWIKLQELTSADRRSRPRGGGA